MIIKPNSYWILKNSNSEFDIVKVNGVSRIRVIFDYWKHDVNWNLSVLKTRELSIKAFLACYKPHNALNILHGPK
jgi:hypothetical protein